MHSSDCGALRNGIQQFDPAGDRFDRRARGAVREGDGEPGVVLDVGRRVPGERHRACVRRAWWSLADADGDGPYRTLGVDKKASEMRSRRPTASLPASTTGYEPGRRVGGGALQGGPGRVRDPVRPEKRKQYDSGGGIFGGGFPAAAASAARAEAPAVASVASATSCPTSSAAPRPGARRGRSEGAISRDRSARVVRAGDGGRPGLRDRAARGACPTCGAPERSRELPRRSAAAARDAASRPSRRASSRSRSHAPVRRDAHRDQGSLPHLSRLGPDPSGEEVRGEHPGRGARRLAVRLKGKVRPARAAARRATYT